MKTLVGAPDPPGEQIVLPSSPSEFEGVWDLSQAITELNRTGPAANPTRGLPTTETTLSSRVHMLNARSSLLVGNYGSLDIVDRTSGINSNGQPVILSRAVGALQGKGMETVFVARGVFVAEQSGKPGQEVPLAQAGLFRFIEILQADLTQVDTNLGFRADPPDFDSMDSFDTIVDAPQNDLINALK